MRVLGRGGRKMSAMKREMDSGGFVEIVRGGGGGEECIAEVRRVGEREPGFVGDF